MRILYDTHIIQVLYDHEIKVMGNCMILTIADEDDSIENSDSTGDEATVRKFDTTCLRERIIKYKIIQNHWKKLYSTDTLMRLHVAVKKHVFTSY